MCTLSDAFRLNSVWLTGKVARQLRDLTRQVQDYELLLNTLQPRLSPQDMQLTEETLAKVGFFCRLTRDSESNLT